MKRLTVSIDDKLAKTLEEYAAAAGCSQASIVRGMLLAIAPTLHSSVVLYKRAQDVGAETQKVLKQAANRLDTEMVPRQQAFVRDWNAMVAQMAEDLEKAANGGHSEFDNI